MKKIIRNFLTDHNKLDLGNKAFLIGVFFLPSALPISALFLLVALILSFRNYEHKLLKDKWNLPLFTSIGIIIFSTLNISFINKPLILAGYSVPTIWINLINWIPLFFYYWGFQKYLITNIQRLLFAKWLVSGSFPVILSFILQKFFSFYGPYETLYGLIVWFQKPIITTGPSSGLFSNQNYAAIWLVLILPFAILLLNYSKNFSLKKIFLITFCFSIIYMILLTASRNGILGIFITIICIYSFRKLLFGILFTISAFSIISFFEILTSEKITFFKEIIPISLISKISDIHFYSYIPRIGIWQSALIRIQERPFWGWGPSTFSFLHIENNSTFSSPHKVIYAEHSHNLTLELAHNFGIPLSIILISTFVLLLIRSWSYIFFSGNSDNALLLKKAFFSSSLIVFITHINDITLYDGKISLLISILLAGLKTILDEKSNKILE